MRKQLTVCAVAAITTLAVLGGTALAAPDKPGTSANVSDPTLLALITDDDLFSIVDLATVLDPVSPTPTQHFGPFASGSPDSGTCGNDWASDSFNRVFTVRSSATGITVIEQFKQGTFVTNADPMDPEPSPGGCETDVGGKVAAGLSGTMHGYFIISLAPGATQTSSDESCIANMPLAECTTPGFIASHFATAGYDVTTFFFHYAGYDGTNQALVVHEWKNASCDRGGDSGDIATISGIASANLC